MFGGSFAGSAAQGLNQALLDWQRIWLAEEEMEKQDQRAREQREFEELRLEWEKERTAAAEAGADARFERQQEWEELSTLWASFEKSESASARAAMVDAFKGTRLYNAAVGAASMDLFANPMEATAFLKEVTNAPVGSRYSPELVKTAAEVSGRFGLNLEGDELQDYINRHVEWANTLDEEFTEERARQREALDLETQQARANLEDTQSRTKLSDAQVRQIDANIELGKKHDMREESRLLWEGEAHQKNMLMLQQEYDQNERINPLLVESLSYDNDGKLFERDIREATKDVTIQRILDEAGLVGIERQLKEIELEFAYGTAELEVAILQGNSDHIAATIDSIRQNIKESEARITSAGIDDEIALAELKEKRITTFTSLMGAGHIDLARKYAHEFVADVVGEEGIDALLDSMAERAQRQLDTETATLESARVLAYWETHFAEQNAKNESRILAAQADDAETRASYSAELIASQIEANNASVRASDANVALQQAKISEILSSGGGGASLPATFLDFMDDNRLTMGWTFEKIANLKSNYDVADQSIRTEEALFNQLATGTPEERAEAVAKLADLYDMEPRFFMNPDNVAELLERKRDEWATTRETSAVDLTNALSILVNNALPLGVDIDPKAFGIDPSAPYWEAALLRNPAIRSVHEADQAALSEAAQRDAPNMYARLEVFSSSNSPELIATLGPSVVWEEMSREYGEDVVAEVFGSPAKLQEQMLEMSRNFTVPFDALVPYFSNKGYDLYSPVDRYNALQELSFTINKASGLLEELRAGGSPGTKPAGVNAAFREVMDMIGQSVAPWQVSMMGRGDMINALTPALAELNSLTQSLLHVDNRIPVGPRENPESSGR